MKSKFVDTNIFIRFLTDDDKIKAKSCFDLFQKANKKEILLTTSESVLAEVVYILSSKQLYNLEAEYICQILSPIIEIKGLKFASKKFFKKALRIYAEFNIDFEDALSVSHMYYTGIKEIYSFDKDFDKFDEIKRLEP